MKDYVVHVHWFVVHAHWFLLSFCLLGRLRDCYHKPLADVRGGGGGGGGGGRVFH